LAFHGDGRSTHCEILPHGDKKQLSWVAFDKSEGHPGGSIALKLRHASWNLSSVPPARFSELESKDQEPNQAEQL